MVRQNKGPNGNFRKPAKKGLSADLTRLPDE
jgi:hypothetical protein